MTLTFAFLFPGQGSQYEGMGKALVDNFPSAMETYELADSILGFSISTLCFQGPELELNDTTNAQLAILVTSVAAYRALSQILDESIKPVAVAGHSLGEYSALVVAGAIDFSSALRLVHARAKAMRSASETAPGGMLAVLRANRDQVEELCEKISLETALVIQIANDNCPGQIVVAGEQIALDAFSQNCREHGISKPVPLKVSVAPHTSLMTEAIPGFLTALSSTQINAPSVPIAGNVSAEWLTTSDEIREELREQLIKPVLWNDSMGLLLSAGVEAVVELGPGKVLTGLMRRIDRQVIRANFGNTLAQLTNVLDLVGQS